MGRYTRLISAAYQEVRGALVLNCWACGWKGDVLVAQKGMGQLGDASGNLHRNFSVAGQPTLRYDLKTHACPPQYRQHIKGAG